ncbi:unnamed protein product, partial [marine sediment metagenome]
MMEIPILWKEWLMLMAAILSLAWWCGRILERDDEG